AFGQLELEPLGGQARAYAERFVRSIKSEYLNRMIFIGQASLRRAAAEFVDHYHAERNHQGLDNGLIRAVPSSVQGVGMVRRKKSNHVSRSRRSPTPIARARLSSGLRSTLQATPVASPDRRSRLLQGRGPPGSRPLVPPFPAPGARPLAELARRCAAWR